HLTARRLDAEVQRTRYDEARVVEQPDHGVTRGIRRHDVARAVAAHPVHDEQLHPVVPIVARQDGLETPTEVLLLVAARHDHGDERRRRASHEVLASAACGQAWKVAVCRLRRAPSAASGHSPRRRAAAQSRETSAPASWRAWTRPVTQSAEQWNPARSKRARRERRGPNARRVRAVNSSPPRRRAWMSSTR